MLSGLLCCAQINMIHSPVLWWMFFGFSKTGHMQGFPRQHRPVVSAAEGRSCAHRDFSRFSHSCDDVTMRYSKPRNIFLKFFRDPKMQCFFADRWTSAHLYFWASLRCSSFKTQSAVSSQHHLLLQFPNFSVKFKMRCCFSWSSKRHFVLLIKCVFMRFPDHCILIY